jgi:flagellar assembly factor FliW
MNKVAIKERTATKSTAKIIIDTRFGKITVDPSKLINFPLGLLGIPHEKKYYLVAYPDKDVQSYSLLQSSQFEKLCFLTIPLVEEFYSTEKSLIAKSDILLAKEHYNIKELSILLVATIHNNKTTKASRISVNLKAPILIDTDKLVAYQHVFIRKEYSLKHYLN